MLNPCPPTIRRLSKLLLPWELRQPSPSYSPVWVQSSLSAMCSACCHQEWPWTGRGGIHHKQSVTSTTQLVKTTHHKRWGLTTLTYTYAGGRGREDYKKRKKSYAQTSNRALPAYKQTLRPQSKRICHSLAFLEVTYSVHIERSHAGYLHTLLILNMLKSVTFLSVNTRVLLANFPSQELRWQQRRRSWKD